MAMKKLMTNLKTLTALLIAGAAFTACSSSDDDIIDQPQNPTEPQVYTLVIKASKGDATTRALKAEGGTIKPYWSGEETIEVGQYDAIEEKYEKLGTARATPSDDGETEITATLSKAPDTTKDLNFYLGGHNIVYTGQVGLLTDDNYSISKKYDYASDRLASGSYTVDNINHKVTPNEYTDPLEFVAASQAIIKFTLKDKASDALISPTALTVIDGTSTVELTSIPSTTYGDNGDGVLYVAFPAAGLAKTITLTATDGSDTYTYTTSSAKTFISGNYYSITVKMSKALPKNLADATTSDKGKLIGTDGNIYATAAAATYAGTTAVAMIIYVGNETGEETPYTHGLALALTDEGSGMRWDEAENACSAKNTSTPVTGGKWLLASNDQWDHMLGTDEPDAGSYEALRTGFESVGGTNMYPAFYWSSSTQTVKKGSFEYTFYYRYHFGNFSKVGGTGTGSARACLAF